MALALIASISALLVVAWATFRSFHLSALRERAQERLAASAQTREALSRHISSALGQPLTAAEIGTYGAVTAAEFVWSWANIDPDLIHAADFASTDSVTSGLSFAEYIHQHFDGLLPAAKEGFVNRLSGYVFEQKAAALLEHAGWTVQLAETANQPIYDALLAHPLLGGEQLANFKNVADTSGILHDAAAHPDVHYQVPGDAHGPTLENVHHLAGLDHAAAKDAVKDGVAAAHGEAAAHGLALHIPFVTIGFAAYRNYRLVRDYGQDVGTAVKHGTIESIGRGSGVIAGGKIGALAGAFFGPVGAFGGAVAGALAGAVGGGAIAEWYKSRPLKAALHNLATALCALGESFAPRLSDIREHILAPLRRMELAHARLSQETAARRQRWRYRLWPDFYTVLLGEAEKSAAPHMQTEHVRADALLTMVDRIESSGDWTQLGLMMSNVPPVREQLGGDETLVTKVMETRQVVLAERHRLDPKHYPHAE